jgi:hypothetical protein
MDFFPIKTPNVRASIYMLSIRAPQPPFLPVELFIFPLSPQSIRKTAVAMSAVYDTMGSPATYGVQRTIDTYGVSPFTYEIEGTTGWDRHMTDGYLYTGMQAIQRIQRLLYNYAQLNQQQRQANSPDSYSLEFSDFFNGEFYQVEPIGPQEFSASDRAPLLQYFRFRLAGIQPIGSPLLNAAESDAIALLFSLPIPSKAATVLAIGAAVAATYTTGLLPDVSQSLTTIGTPPF